MHIWYAIKAYEKIGFINFYVSYIYLFKLSKSLLLSKLAFYEKENVTVYKFK